MPRAMAMAIAMPLITSGPRWRRCSAACWRPTWRWASRRNILHVALPAAVEVSNLTLAVGKSMVFGVLIALVGCHYGCASSPIPRAWARARRPRS
jgi:phospholipid/cholesterol/gamma-HCH transport system permease protein